MVCKKRNIFYCLVNKVFKLFIKVTMYSLTFIKQKKKELLNYLLSNKHDVKMLINFAFTTIFLFVIKHVWILIKY